MERSRCRKSSSEGCTSWNRFLVWWLSVRRGRLILVVQLKSEEDKKLDHGSNVSSRLLIKLNRCFDFPITKLNYLYYNNKQGIQLFILEWGHKQRGSDSDAGQIIVRPRLQKAQERLAGDLQTMCQFMHTDTVSAFQRSTESPTDYRATNEQTWPRSWQCRCRLLLWISQT